VDVAGPFWHWSSSSPGLAMTLDALHTGIRHIAKWPYSILTLYGYTHSRPDWWHVHIAMYYMLPKFYCTHHIYIEHRQHLVHVVVYIATVLPHGSERRC